MSRWFLVSCGGACVAAVVAFLRIVSNEIEAVEKEAEHIRRTEAAKRRPAEGDADLDQAA